MLSKIFQLLILLSAAIGTFLQFYSLFLPHWSKETKSSSEVSHLGKSYGGLWYRCYTRKFKGDFTCDNYARPFFALNLLLKLRIVYTTGVSIGSLSLLCHLLAQDCNETLEIYSSIFWLL